MIENGNKVSVEYTLRLDDGSEADTNVGGDPLVFRQGSSEVLPAFEAQLAGMQVDETKEFTLSAAEGYGEFDPELRQEVEAEVVPEDGRHVGAQLISEDPSGNRRLIRVHEVRGDNLVLDMNHPLAGESLHFDVKILAIE
ncbi:MAG: FKBP-type peptidyl-prolyl cis-trans isomerase [Myxococcota bacterium]